MDAPGTVEEAVQLLQELGLKEYEARCFVGLTRLDSGTAKNVADLTAVPRTRVYDAIRVLESKGLVEVRHSSPKQFRAVPLEEAIETLRDHYEGRMDVLHDVLETVETVEDGEETPVQQVWAMEGREAIENRTEELMAGATDEIVLVLGDDSLLTDDLVASLTEAGTGADVILGAPSEDLRAQIRQIVPVATAFITGLDWLHGDDHESDTAIGRLLLVDRSAFLVSSIMPETKDEQAVYGEGFGNGLLVIARRLMSQGLVPVQDPAK